MNGQAVVPAGWYDDGSARGVQRWYDGTGWTEHLRPVEGPPAPPTGWAAPAGPAAPTASAAPVPAASPATSTQQWSPGDLHPSLDLPPVTTATPTWAGAQQAPVQSSIGTYGGPGTTPSRPGWAPPQDTGAAAPPAGYGPQSGHGQPVGFGHPAGHGPQSGYGQPVGFGHPAGYGQPVGFGSPAGYGRPAGFGGLGDAGHHRSRAIGLFWAGVGVLTFGGITGLLADGTHGGVVWTGGLVTGTLLLVRAGTSFRSAREAGAPALGGGGVALGVVAGLVAVVVGVSGLVHYATGIGVGPLRGLPGPVAGSCWRELSNDTVVQVRCSTVHDYTARIASADPAACQILTEKVLPIDDGTYLCLVPELTGTT